MQLSKFGQKFTADSGILELMEDLGKALSGGKKYYMLGGGNPAHIPGLQKIFRKRMNDILDNEGEFENLISNYDGPAGNNKFVETFVNFINRKYDWGITKENIAITTGSQSGFFILLNLLAGEFKDGKAKKVLFPIVPEYIGYTDQGLGDDFFIGLEPKINFTTDHEFKYGIDFDRVEKALSSDIAAICLSRPTNPTGNVVTDEELKKLDKIARENNIPLIVDNAYGDPFPNVIYEDVKLTWNENIVLSFSLSKVGLPSSRTGIIIAKKEIAQAVSKVNAILSLANSSYGQALIRPLLENDEILKISKDIIYPYYKDKADFAKKTVKKYFDNDLPYYLHKTEGAFFFWFWFKDLPITTKELYQRLKKRDVIIVPGEYFFPGLQNENWKHATECIRVNYARPEDEIENGIRILAEEVKKAYQI